MYRREIFWPLVERGKPWPMRWPKCRGWAFTAAVRAKKNGVPPYTNLVNLKSNTMKNTLQRYDKFHFLQIFYIKNGVKNTFS